MNRETTRSRFSPARLIAGAVMGALIGVAGLVSSAAQAQDNLTGFTGTVNVQGNVDGSGTSDVRVYSNGILIKEGSTDNTGRFDLRFDVSGAKDETLVIWFIPDTEELVPELLILKESANARRNTVWSPCVAREKATDVVIYDVKFRDKKTVLEDLEESDCFERG